METQHTQTYECWKIKALEAKFNAYVKKKFEHMIKARAHKGGVRIGKTPKKLASICCL
jgi:hypothetical protein